MSYEVSKPFKLNGHSELKAQCTVGDKFTPSSVRYAVQHTRQ